MKRSLSFDRREESITSDCAELFKFAAHRFLTSFEMTPLFNRLNVYEKLAFIGVN